MPEVDPKLADWTTRELRARGIEVRTGTLLESVEDDCAKLSTGETIPTRTVCWTAGVKPPAIVRELGLPLQPNGRIDVDRTMRVRGPRTSGPSATARRCPTRANYERPAPADVPARAAPGQARAENVAAQIGHGKVAPVHVQDARRVRRPGPQPGGRQDVGTQPERLPAWWAARTYHLAMMPGRAQVGLMVDWTVGPFGATRPSSASWAIRRRCTATWSPGRAASPQRDRPEASGVTSPT